MRESNHTGRPVRLHKLQVAGCQEVKIVKKRLFYVLAGSLLLAAVAVATQTTRQPLAISLRQPTSSPSAQ